MNRFLKIDKRVIGLSPQAAGLYLYLVHANSAGMTIHRSYLAECTGLTNLDHISKLIKDIEDLNLIKRNNSFKVNHITAEIKQTLAYEVIYENFYKVDDAFLRCDLPLKTKGFALMLRTLAFDDTLYIRMNKTEISNAIDMTPTTARKYMKELSFVKRDSTGYYFDQYFIPNSDGVVKLSEDRMKELGMILANDQDDKITNQAKYFVSKKLQYSLNANEAYDKMVAGLWNKK